MTVTVQQLATHMLGRPATTGGDFAKVRLPIMGGCGVCGATVAAYNSCPSKAGFLKCANDCIADDGFDDVVAAAAAVFCSESDPCPVCAGQESGACYAEPQS